METDTDMLIDTLTDDSRINICFTQHSWCTSNNNHKKNDLGPPFRRSAIPGVRHSGGPPFRRSAIPEVRH